MPVLVCCRQSDKNRSVSCSHEINGLIGKIKSYKNKCASTSLISSSKDMCMGGMEASNRCL